MTLQHHGVEQRASARLAVRDRLTSVGHSLKFWPSDRLGLISGRVRRWIKKAVEKIALCNIPDEIEVELYGTEDDRNLMARYKARREASGMAEIDRSMARVREAVHEATLNRRH